MPFETIEQEQSSAEEAVAKRKEGIQNRIDLLANRMTPQVKAAYESAGSREAVERAVAQLFEARSAVELAKEKYNEALLRVDGLSSSPKKENHSFARFTEHAQAGYPTYDDDPVVGYGLAMAQKKQLQKELESLGG